MLKKKMTYMDYDGNERTEDFYFNLSRAEITEMEVSETGGLVNMIERVIAEQDSKQIIKIFKDLILQSYGVKSPDGKRFIKSDELREAFTQTEAYSDLFMELAENADSAATFVNGIIPKQPQDRVQSNK